jgi:hypothetical protein
VDEEDEELSKRISEGYKEEKRNSKKGTVIRKGKMI